MASWYNNVGLETAGLMIPERPSLGTKRTWHPHLLSSKGNYRMVNPRRVGDLVDRLANSEDLEPTPSGVLLFSPNLLRLIAVCVYGVYVLAFTYSLFTSDFFNGWYLEENDTRFFYGQLGLVLTGAIGTGAVLLFARSHYKACMLGTSLFAISSGMTGLAYMYGLDINPHIILVVTPLLVLGFTVGWNGLLIGAAWIMVTYLFLRLADAWGWWPRPTIITPEAVKHENLSALILMLCVVLATQFYLRKVGITLHKHGQLHEELEEKQRYQIDLLSRIVTAQDEERKRIAHLLHEGPVQDMAALRLAIRNDASQDELVGMIDEMVTKLRTVSGNLYPATLDLYGLPAALNQLAAQQQARNLEIMVSYPQLEDLDPRVGTVFFRIAQEALNNVRKHSGAKHVWIGLEESAGVITLEVQDDGKGFDVEPVQRQAVQAGHLGLATLRELALSVGGTLQIISRPGHGTTVKVAVPYPQPVTHRPSDQQSNQNTREERKGLI
jgi:signal transduction histidine kinase